MFTGNVKLNWKIGLSLLFLILGVVTTFSYIVYERVERISVRAFEDGLGSGSTYTTATLQRSDTLKFGKIVGSAEVTVVITTPSKGEPDLLTSTEWESTKNLTATQDSWGHAFSAPYDGSYEILVDNRGLPQEDFHVSIVRTGREMILLYAGALLLITSAVVGIITSITLSVDARKR